MGRGSYIVFALVVLVLVTLFNLEHVGERNGSRNWSGSSGGSGGGGGSWSSGGGGHK